MGEKSVIALLVVCWSWHHFLLGVGVESPKIFFLFYYFVLFCAFFQTLPSHVQVSIKETAAPFHRLLPVHSRNDKNWSNLSGFSTFSLLRNKPIVLSPKFGFFPSRTPTVGWNPGFSSRSSTPRQLDIFVLVHRIENLLLLFLILEIWKKKISKSIDCDYKDGFSSICSIWITNQKIF